MRVWNDSFILQSSLFKTIKWTWDSPQVWLIYLWFREQQVYLRKTECKVRKTLTLTRFVSSAMFQYVMFTMVPLSLLCEWVCSKFNQENCQTGQNSLKYWSSCATQKLFIWQLRAPLEDLFLPKFVQNVTLSLTQDNKPSCRNYVQSTNLPTYLPDSARQSRAKNDNQQVHSFFGAPQPVSKRAHDRTKTCSSECVCVSRGRDRYKYIL